MPPSAASPSSRSVFEETKKHVTVTFDYLTVSITGVPTDVLKTRCAALRPPRAVKHRDVFRVRGGLITLHRPRHEMMVKLNSLCEALRVEYGGSYRFTELEVSLDVRARDRNTDCLPEFLKWIRQHHAPQDVDLGNRYAFSKGKGMSSLLRTHSMGDVIHHESVENATEYSGNTPGWGGGLQFRSYLKKDDALTGTRTALGPKHWSARLEVTLFETGLARYGLSDLESLLSGYPFRSIFSSLFQMASPVAIPSRIPAKATSDTESLLNVITQWRERRVAQLANIGPRATRDAGFPTSEKPIVQVNRQIGDALGNAERSLL